METGRTGRESENGPLHGAGLDHLIKVANWGALPMILRTADLPADVRLSLEALAERRNAEKRRRGARECSEQPQP